VELRAVVQVRLGQVLSFRLGVPGRQAALLALTALGALVSLVDTPYPDLAPLQNLPTLVLVAGGWLALRRWPMPTSAVLCACAFLWLHTIGGRYIYSFVPYEDWARTLGLPSPRATLGLERNAWDRLVHFSFGLCCVHPIACWLTRHRGLSPRLAIYIAVEFVFAGSAVYEIFEWLLTVIMAGPDALAYNGQQGDPWDPQKDMAIAGLGAVLAGAWNFARSSSRT
jgi:putative membrane protein